MTGYQKQQTNIYFPNENYNNRDSFEIEFAKRTLANLQFIEKEVEKRHQQGIDDKNIHDVFEVTQLINSFVGMIILPKESFFERLRHNDRFLSPEGNLLLNRLSNDLSKYESTYTYTQGGERRRERLTPKNLSRHLRNAIAHNNLEIIPRDYSKSGKVEGFIFKDNNDWGERFRLELTIDEIRVLLLEECKLILSLA